MASSEEEGCRINFPRSNRSTTMNAIYTAILVALTLAYSTVAWIGLSMDANANEVLF
ncbi:Protein CBG18332 [Caenorhabditis briggsae]|uniref:Protein CBG18332 n=1 Tax=Caenorhabditis briggsae TaxID=6238 RepID=A8XSG3_CAEBR|nr:Protein CBG18332 [Caenorhabditis briggsae]CAP35805.1 Protein CBG18332 [Caenorhabditis briggsae]